MAGRDITEGRSTRAIAVELGVGIGTLWQNTNVSYDVAIGGEPFLLAIDDEHPYERSTAPFRKQQFDSQRDPGEQSLTGWWLRSQSSFHTGEGIKYYDPLANPYSTTIATNSYRINKAYGVDIWEPGQVTLLKEVNQGHNTLTPIDPVNDRPYQRLFSVKWNGNQGVILHDGFDLDRIDANGTVEHWVDYNTGTADRVYAATTDGKTMYWITNSASSGAGGKTRMEKKDISASTSTPATTMWTAASTFTQRATIGYVKQRIVVASNNEIYAFPITQSTAPSPIYTHPSSSYVFTSVAESGSAIYISGFEGNKSSIFKFTLDTTGAMPALSGGAITAAEMPAGERIHRIFNYLGYMVIGTSKGVRVASISDTTGDLTYGPIIFHTDHPVYDFCARDSYIWCASSVQDGTNVPGVIRIDLSQEIDTLRFAYANDAMYDGTSGFITTSCAFIGETDRVTFCTAAPNTSSVGYYYSQSATDFRTDGYLDTGFVRFNTLEPKNFKRVVGNGNFTFGSMSLQAIDINGTIYDINSYDAAVGSPESTITAPAGAQEAIGLRFHLYRDASDPTLGPTFTGYQLKAVPATPRSRIIKVPVFNFDTETDKYNTTVGYEGRAIERLASLEAVESNGDVITFQDFRTGVIYQCLIEEVAFQNLTPPDKKLTNFGGIITITLRTV